jgi:large subunit ribosomal protein L18
MILKPSRSVIRKRKHVRVRKKISGTSLRPRLAVFRSNKFIYAQIIDDVTGKTLVSSSSLLLKGTKVDVAQKTGEDIAKKAIAANISEVVFDRGGYIYHGRVKALADAARTNGLKF